MLAAVGAVLLLSGCSEDASRGWLPRGASTDADVVQPFWVATWIAALAVTALVLGLILWTMFRYRRRADETGLPAQVRYNMPMEILYTVVPIFMVAALFAQTVDRDDKLMRSDPNPDIVVNVVGKQWSWDFNYINENVHVVGVQADLSDGEPGKRDTLPELWLPVNKRTQFVLSARDVIHSFWVPAFQKKLDMIPGRINSFDVTPTEIGEFDGKCAELCGSYHSEMLFVVKVVSQEDYDKHIAELRASGGEGLIDADGDRSELAPGEQELIPTAKASS